MSTKHLSKPDTHSQGISASPQRSLPAELNLAQERCSHPGGGAGPEGCGAAVGCHEDAAGCCRDAVDAVPAECNALYLGTVSTETLAGAPAVQKATSCTLELDPLPTPTLVRLRVSEQGVTLTDVQRRSGLRAGRSAALCFAALHVFRSRAVLQPRTGWPCAPSTARCCNQRCSSSAGVLLWG